jgi:CBS domain-containing protein
MALDALGFPLCKGGIMASNPSWCLTEAEWRSRFTSWISEPTPVALLNANIFFDFRALHGDASLADRLSSWLLARTQENKLFLRLMVANALQTEPPLGLIRAFEVDTGPEGDGTLDLKRAGRACSSMLRACSRSATALPRQARSSASARRAN